MTRPELAALLIFGLWLLGFLLLARRKSLSELLPAAKGTDSLAGLSIIIPARNEAKNLPRLLATLKAPLPFAMEVIVVDDASTDATAELARAGGVRVVTAPLLTEGWTGKTRACLAGAEAARFPHLLFLDADTWFRPGGLEHLYRYFVRLNQERGPVAVSILPYHFTAKFYESFSLYFNLMMAMGTGAFSFWRGPVKLVGQSLLVDRRAYFTVGGHGAVRGQVLENFFLSEPLGRAGVRCHTYLGRELLEMQMFPEGFLSLWQGWLKAFARGAGGVQKRELIICILWISAPMTLIMMTGAMTWPLWFSLYGLCVLQLGVLGRALGNFPAGALLLFPLPLLFFILLFTVSTFRTVMGTSSHWRGRQLPSGNSGG